MPPPDDFGLSPVATLAHVAELTPVPMHRPFWNRWREAFAREMPASDAVGNGAVAALSPRLVPAEPPDRSDPTATHRFESLGSVRIGCVIELPPKGTPVRAGLVTTHGYEVGERLGEAAHRWRVLAARGVAVMVMRVRGHPGSQLDTGDWTGDPTSLGWITHGFPPSLNGPEDALGWALPQAVADVACGGRALRDWLAARANAAGATTPIFLHGESFGGGLAVMCAAQTPGEFVRFERVALGLPTFGDWSWRLADPSRMAFGSGAQLVALLRSLGWARAADTLRLCDAARHARRVLAPTLCKLALRDEVVPAPCAGAVFNALGADPGRKWRFLVPEGHSEPSLTCARRVALFERCLTDFLDPARDPAEAMADWEPVLIGGDRAPTRETAP